MVVHNVIKEKFLNLLTQVIIKVEQEVLATYKTIKSNKHYIEESPKQNNLCLQLDKRLYSSFTKTSIKIPYQKHIKRIECNFVLYNRAKDFLEHNTPHDPKLYVKNKELYIAIPFDVPTPILSNEEVLGIDVGIRCIASCSDGRNFICDDFKKEKRKLKYLRRCLQSKGTKSAKRHLKKIRKKIGNYSNNYMHHLANEILKTDKDIIVMEDIKNIKENTKYHKGINIKRTSHNRAFGDIPVYDLKQKLTYKASHLGKVVVTVSPYNTSQNDCTSTDKGLRQGRRYYCKNGKQLDADINASVNIANVYITYGNITTKHPISYPEKIYHIGRLQINQPIVISKSQTTLL